MTIHTTNVGQMLDVFFIDYKEDNLYPFKACCLVVRSGTCRDGTLSLIRNLGMGFIDDIISGRGTLPKKLTIVFPERWISVKEQQAFMYSISKHPSVANIKEVYIVTSSPLIISDFTREHVRIVETI